jgi:hypothetical protein
MRAFRIPHALHIVRQFSEFSGISNTLLSLGFGILLLLHLILLAFPMLILRVVGLTKRTLLALVIFLDLLSFAGLLKNNLLLHSPSPRLSMWLLLADSLDSAHHERLWSEVWESSPHVR